MPATPLLVIRLRARRALRAEPPGMARKRKANVRRDRRGKSRGERPAIDPAVLAARARELLREGVSPEHAGDALAGFTLGRLLLRGRASPGNPGSITQRQYDAGDRWAQIVRAHARLMGYRLTCPSPSFVLSGSGRACAEDAEEHQVRRIRQMYAACYNALIEAGKPAPTARRAGSRWR